MSRWCIENPILHKNMSVGPPQHLHKYIALNERDIVKLHFNVPAYVYLMDDTNYGFYLARKQYEYYGDLVKKTPFMVRAPEAGKWHLVIERQNPAETLSVAVQIVQDV